MKKVDENNLSVTETENTETKELAEEKAIRAAAEKSEKQVTAAAPEKESTSEKQKTEPVRLPKEKG